MNQELIEKARRGEIAVHNVDCSVEELRQVVKDIWPDQHNDLRTELNPEFMHYFIHNGQLSCGVLLFLQKRLEAVPVRDFLTEKETEQ